MIGAWVVGEELDSELLEDVSEILEDVILTGVDFLELDSHTSNF